MAKNSFSVAILNFYNKTGSSFQTYILYQSLLLNLKIYHQNFENISISSWLIDEKQVFGGHLEFYDQTGSRFFELIFLTNHYNRTWKFAIRILKISQLFLVLFTKTRFSAAILNFYDQTGSRFFETIFFSNHYHWTWKFAIRILKISQLVLVLFTINRFSAAILNFYDQTGSRFFETIFFTNHYHQTWKFATKISKISQLVLVLLTKNRFSAAILNFTTKPEVIF